MSFSIAHQTHLDLLPSLISLIKAHKENPTIFGCDISHPVTHFPIDQYLLDRVTPATLSPKPITYDKPIDPAEMPRISTCTKMTTEDTNVPTQDDKYPWLDPDDK